MKKRILSFDGGGVRGALSAKLVERIAQSFPDWTDQADLIAGTSTGGILALGLAAGLGPARIVQLYKDYAEKIFGSRDWVDSIAKDEAWRANYGQEGLRDALESTFGDMTLGDLQQRVLIPAFQLRRFSPHFMDSDKEPELLVVDVALRTSAAPTYFPSYQGFVDGGVAANNPADCAVACLQNDGVESEDIVVVSVGTGTHPREVEGGDWGLTQWAGHIIQLMLEGPQDSALYRTRRTVGEERVLRLDPPLHKVVELDDASELDTLLNIACGHDMTEAMRWFRSTWQ